VPARTRAVSRRDHQTGPRLEPHRSTRRRYYQITEVGQAAARAQLRHLQAVIDIARTKPLLRPGPA
jgi:DNA-binding PadR family transcriptional regulator